MKILLPLLFLIAFPALGEESTPKESEISKSITELFKGADKGDYTYHDVKVAMISMLEKHVSKTTSLSRLNSHHEEMIELLKAQTKTQEIQIGIKDREIEKLKLTIQKMELEAKKEAGKE